MFKQCSLCNHQWKNREDFLTDPDLEIVGYQACFDEAKDGLFLFNHHCETTLAMKVYEFDDLHQGVRYETAAKDTPDCSGFCLHKNELRSCPVQCKYAYVRDIIQTIRKWPKNEGYVS